MKDKKKFEEPIVEIVNFYADSLMDLSGLNYVNDDGDDDGTPAYKGNNFFN